ncbi:MAG: Ig-like domain-containing protein [Acidobacteriaceae bacterium]
MVSLGLLVLSGCGGGTTITLCTGCTSQGPPISTTTTMTAAPQEATVGNPVTFTANVSPATNGVVEFFDAMEDNYIDQVLLYSGVATGSVTALGVGTHVLTATFTLDGQYQASTSSPGVVVTVSAAGANCGLGTATYTLTSGTATQSGASYSATANNQSAVCAANSGTSLTLNNPSISNSGYSGQYGDVSNDDISGIGAAVLAYGPSTSSASGASVTITGGSITTASIGTDDLFASGLGSSISATGTTLSTTYFGVTNGSGARLSYNHAAAAARGGSVTLNNVSASNTEYSGALFSVDGDGSAIIVNGGSFVSNAYSSTARIEGNGSLTLNNATVTGSPEYGVEFTSSATDGSSPGAGSLTMTGGSFALSSASGLGSSILVSDGAEAAVSLTGTNLIPAAPVPGITPIFLAAGTGFGGTTGAVVTLNANGVTIPGVLQYGYASTLNVSLLNTTGWNGWFEVSSPQPGAANLTMDASSTWSVSAPCHVETFSDPGGISGLNVVNVTGNGYTVTYNPAKNPTLGGLTYNLSGGGSLTPGAE